MERKAIDMDAYARMLSRLKTAEAMERFSSFYGNRDGTLAHQLTRYTELVKYHEDVYHSEKELHLFSASGRTELLGNHTDHNNGKVMAAAVTLDTLAAVTPRDDMRVLVQSCGYPPLDLDLSDLSVKEEEKGTSAALVRGVAAGLARSGCSVGGFEATVTSEVQGGSGLSSSAAYEVLMCLILDTLYNGNRVDAVERAKIAQYAENEYFGKPCGLMDQMASSVGGLVYIDFKNLPDQPEIEPLSLDLASAGYTMVVVNTRGSHDDLTNEYASIRTEMNSVAAFFGEKVLRRVRPEQFHQDLGKVRAACGDRACLRSAHFFAENERVKQTRKAVKENNISDLLRMMNLSGASSWQLLQNLYVPGSSQPLSLALMAAEEMLGEDGAHRVHGGGFAGTTLNVVPNQKVSCFVRRMESIFGPGCCFVLDIRAEGAAVVF